MIKTTQFAWFFYFYKMNKTQIINNTITFVKETLKDAEGGHDWFHIERVYKNALFIAKEENVDEFIVSFTKVIVLLII